MGFLRDDYLEMNILSLNQIMSIIDTVVMQTKKIMS